MVDILLGLSSISSRCERGHCSFSLKQSFEKLFIDLQLTLISTKSSVPPPGRNLLIKATPFGDSLRRRQSGSSDSGYLDSTGQIQPLCQKGSIFRLVGGQLFSEAEQISVSLDVSSARFGTTIPVEALEDIFAIARDDTLFWNNGAFTDGSAKFGADTGGVVHAFFSGSVANNFTAVSLEALASESHTSM